MAKDIILYNRAKYFYEMAEYEFNAHVDLAKKDLDLRLIVGYAAGQSLELILKQLCENLIGDYPETHKIIVLCDRLNRVLYGKTPTKLPMVAAAKLKNYIKDISSDAKLYEDLAYGARYIPDIKISMDELNGLFKITEKVLRFYVEMENELQ